MTETTKPFDYHPDSLDRTRRFSALSGIEIEDSTTRTEALKQLSAREFIDLLAVGNGLLRDEPRFQRWNDQPANARVGYKDMSAELVPPAHADEEFGRLFADIQEKLTPDQESINQAAVRLFFGIVGAHMFPDGNGRTARAAYFLMKDGKFPDDEAVASNTATSARLISERVNKQAVRDLQAEAGLSLERAEEEDAFIAEEVEDGLMANYGMSQHLKYLAIRRLRQREGLDKPDERAPHSLILDAQSEFVQANYREEYDRIRSEWFHKFSTEVPLRYVPACMKYIETRVDEKAEAYS